MTMDGTAPEAHGTRAEHVLEARLDRARMHAAKRLGLNLAAFAVSIVSGGGGEDVLPGFDLVVVRRDSGAEVLRARAGQFEEADRLLAQTRRELASMSVEQFVREWRVIED
jgi:hypothetical protein